MSFSQQQTVVPNMHPKLQRICMCKLHVFLVVETSASQNCMCMGHVQTSANENCMCRGMCPPPPSIRQSLDQQFHSGKKSLYFSGPTVNSDRTEAFSPLHIHLHMHFALHFWCACTCTSLLHMHFCCTCTLPLHVWTFARALWCI